MCRSVANTFPPGSSLIGPSGTVSVFSVLTFGSVSYRLGFSHPDGDLDRPVQPPAVNPGYDLTTPNCTWVTLRRMNNQEGILPVKGPVCSGHHLADVETTRNQRCEGRSLQAELPTPLQREFQGEGPPSALRSRLTCHHPASMPCDLPQRELTLSSTHPLRLASEVAFPTKP